MHHSPDTISPVIKDIAHQRTMVACRCDGTSNTTNISSPANIPEHVISKFSWSTLFCLHREMKGHWSRVNLVKRDSLLKDLHANSVLSFPNANKKCTSILKFLLKAILQVLIYKAFMINHIWGLKQLWLQVNGHAWFHLQRLRWPVRYGEGAKNSKWKYMSPAGFEPTPRQFTTGKLQRLRPLGHAG